MVFALTAGQKLAVKTGAKVVIVTGTALGAANVQSKILNNSAQKTSDAVNEAMKNVTAVREEQDAKIEAGETTKEAAIALVEDAKSKILTVEEVAARQKKARNKATAAGAGVAALGAAVAVGADILIDKYL